MNAAAAAAASTARACVPALTVALLLLPLALFGHVDFDFVPDVVNYSPESVLQVTFGDKAVDVGNELTPTQVKSEPAVSWPAGDGEFYTLCMTDPDAPSREKPTFREFLHWLVVNVPGTDVSKGERLAQYVGSGPPKGTGLHRYVLLLFKQPGKLSFSDELRRNSTSREGRIQFSIQKFADTYNLEQPAAAGNFYLAQWDEYVPILHQQLGRR